MKDSRIRNIIAGTIIMIVAVATIVVIRTAHKPISMDNSRPLPMDERA